MGYLPSGKHGIGEIPYLSAPGLGDRGLVYCVERSTKSSLPYACEITDAGRAFVAELA